MQFVATSDALDAWCAGALHWVVRGTVGKQIATLDQLAACYGGQWAMHCYLPDGCQRVTWESLATVKAGQTITLDADKHPKFTFPGAEALPDYVRSTLHQHNKEHPRGK